MSEKPGTTIVYYHFIEGSRFLLADERDKWRFLASVRAIQQKKNWEIYAFCLTDSGAYFVTESVCFFEVLNELEKICIICNSGYRELRTQQEIIGQCRLLHRIPLALGYVNRIPDYWWSSYNSYMGIYQWALVNCHTVNMYFSDDPEEARNRFRRFHMKEHRETI